MTTTYNQIIKSFEDYCDRNHQINTFFTGKNWLNQIEEIIFPAVALIPQPSSINSGIIKLRFNLIIIDLLKADGSNLNELYSDTLLIIADIISFFKDSYGENNVYFYLDETDVPIEPFEEFIDDNTAGWIASFYIDIPFSGSNCNIPMR